MHSSLIPDAKETLSAEAIKRNKVIGKHHTHRWVVEHNSVKGWHLALRPIVDPKAKKEEILEVSPDAVADAA